MDGRMPVKSKSVGEIIRGPITVRHMLPLTVFINSHYCPVDTNQLPNKTFARVPPNWNSEKVGVLRSRTSVVSGPLEIPVGRLPRPILYVTPFLCLLRAFGSQFDEHRADISLFSPFFSNFFVCSGYRHFYCHTLSSTRRCDDSGENGFRR